MKMTGIVSQGVALLYLHFFLRRSQLFKERICSSRSKFVPFRVVPFQKATFEQTEFNASKCFIFGKEPGAFVRAGAFNIYIYIFSRLSLSRSRRDPLKHFEISVLRHIRFAVWRKIPNEQPNFTNEPVN